MSSPGTIRTHTRKSTVTCTDTVRVRFIRFLGAAGFAAALLVCAPGLLLAPFEAHASARTHAAQPSPGAARLQTAAQTASANGSSVLPITRIYGRWIAIPVRINGQGPYRFIIDTAASNTVLFEDTRADLGLEAEAKTLATVVFGLEERTLPLYALETMTVGPFTKHGLRTVTVPSWFLFGEERPDGLLGMDFLSAYFVLVDLSANQLTLTRERPDALEGTWTSTRLRAVDFDTLATALYVTRVTINADTFAALIDTGASTSFLSENAARRIGAPPPVMMRRDGRMADAVGGRESIYRVLAEKLVIGRKRWEKPRFIVKNLRIFDYLARDFRNPAILGIDILARQNFALDFPRRRLWLRRR